MRHLIVQSVQHLIQYPQTFRCDVLVNLKYLQIGSDDTVIPPVTSSFMIPPAISQVPLPNDLDVIGETPPGKGYGKSISVDLHSDGDAVAMAHSLAPGETSAAIYAAETSIPRGWLCL